MSASPGDSSLSLGYVACHGARVRAHMRSVAAVLTITGRLDATNVDVVAAHLARFTRLGDALVVDVLGIEIDDGASLQRLVSLLDAECHLHGADWVLVADAVGHDLASINDDHVRQADSLPEALRHFARAIASRRNLRLAM